jgi:hypothetical protein
MFTLFLSAENKELEKFNLSWNNIRGKGAVGIFKVEDIVFYILD